MELIHTFQRFIRRLALPSQINTVSSEFLAWRQQFFTERLQLLAWIVLILVTLLNLTVVIPSLNSTGDPKLMFSYARMQNYLERALTQVTCFSIGLLICRSPWIHQAPVKVFLLFNALIVLPSQIQAALYGGISLDSEIWLIFYPLQAFLIPVHWRLQVLCQAVPLVYFLIGFIFGLRDPYINLLPPYVVTGLYTLVICAVADSGAFLF